MAEKSQPSTARVEIRTPFTCASCGGTFFERHSCPSMPWSSTSPTLTIRISTATFHTTIPTIFGGGNQ